jgi:hypothetical protein
VSSDLSKFQSLWWSENQGLSFFYIKTIFQPILTQNTYKKNLNNHDKFIYNLKKIQKTILKT